MQDEVDHIVAGGVPKLSIALPAPVLVAQRHMGDLMEYEALEDLPGEGSSIGLVDPEVGAIRSGGGDLLGEDDLQLHCNQRPEGLGFQGLYPGSF